MFEQPNARIDPNKKSSTREVKLKITKAIVKSTRQRSKDNIGSRNDFILTSQGRNSTTVSLIEYSQQLRSPVTLTGDAISITTTSTVWFSKLLFSNFQTVNSNWFLTIFDYSSNRYSLLFFFQTYSTLYHFLDQFSL